MTDVVVKETVVKNPCRYCGHSPDDHRFDDDRLVEMEERGIGWDDRPFRCVGPDMGLNGCNMRCPDFVGEPVTIVAVS